VVFGGLRARVGEGAKFFSFLVIGENIGGMKKGKAAMHKNAVVNGVMEGVNGELAFASLDECTEEAAIAQIKKQLNADKVEL
jgi:hypothetical protein